jgi:predicted enzyme involved in methoxymalonyl-ACP biosynthesis
MSCRVLKHGVERLLLNSVVAAASRRGLKRVVGEYSPTPKNDLVREHYRALGFIQIDGEMPGHTYWELRVEDQWKPLQHFIRESSSDEPIAV